MFDIVFFLFLDLIPQQYKLNKFLKNVFCKKTHFSLTSG